MRMRHTSAVVGVTSLMLAASFGSVQAGQEDEVASPSDAVSLEPDGEPGQIDSPCDTYLGHVAAGDAAAATDWLREQGLPAGDAIDASVAERVDVMAVNCHASGPPASVDSVSSPLADDQRRDVGMWVVFHPDVPAAERRQSMRDMAEQRGYRGDVEELEHGYLVHRASARDDSPASDRRQDTDRRSDRSTLAGEHG